MPRGSGNRRSFFTTSLQRKSEYVCLVKGINHANLVFFHCIDNSLVIISGMYPHALASLHGESVVNGLSLRSTVL